MNRLAACASLLVGTVAWAGGLVAPPTHERGSAADFESLPSDPGIPSLRQLIGHEIGERFTRHHQVVGAFEAIAEASDRVQVREYGRSHQNRPLVVAIVSSPENLARLDEIKAGSRRLADPATPEREARRIIDESPAISWLSFAVHGNEASTPEAALLTLHRLASAQGPEIDQILDESVVVIDPTLNPDGRMRYVAWFENAFGRAPQPDPQAMEHWEPWPGGRTNHYLFDLNRDWIWLVHPESQARLRIYREFMPQLHIDNHEQGYTNPYFFGAGDDPYNQNIPAVTRDWVEYYGEHYAEIFDREGKLYSTKERFDYLYPGYGKVLPVYHGAVGMLNEQGGHSRAGLGIRIDENYILTLGERSRNHFLVNMGAVELTAKNRRAQLQRFRDYFTDSVSLADRDPWACVVSADNDPAQLELLWDFCQAHGIRIDQSRRAIDGSRLRSYRTGEAASDDSAPAGSWIISADQAMGRLVRATFERNPELTDIDTYDITSWSLPVAFGLEAWYAERDVSNGARPLASWSRPDATFTGSGSVALIVDSGQHEFPKAIAIAERHELSARLSGDPIEIEGAGAGRSSLVIHLLRNRHVDVEAVVRDFNAAGLSVRQVDRGITESGPVLGANANRDLEHPAVALVGGAPVSSYSFGAHRHALDFHAEIDYSALYADRLARTDLSKYTTIVIPDGRGLDDATAEALGEWVRDGGTLVATGGGASWAEEAIGGLEPGEVDDERPPLELLSNEEREARRVQDRISGGLFQVTLDASHPLTAGAGEWVGVIKRNDRVLTTNDETEVIGRYHASEPVIGGAVSERNRERLAGRPFMTLHRIGAGRVICIADDTTFRGFLHGSRRLLLNAITLGPTW